MGMGGLPVKRPTPYRVNRPRPRMNRAARRAQAEMIKYLIPAFFAMYLLTQIPKG